MYSAKRNTQQTYWGNSIYEFEVYGTFLTALDEEGPTNETNHLQIYPNPCADEVLVDFPTTHSEAQVRLYDGSGKLIYDRVIDAGVNTISLNTGALEPGLYIVTLYNGEAILTAYLVKNIP